MKSRRTFLKQTGLAMAGATLLANKGFSMALSQSPTFGKQVYPFKVSPLAFGYSDLEPFMGTDELVVHYEQLHNENVQGLNNALANVFMGPITLEALLKRASEYTPEVQQLAGSHYNHSLFWATLKANPNAGLTNAPSPGRFHTQLMQDFGDITNLQNMMHQSAMSVFGSGWVWLVAKENGKIELAITENEQNPLMNNVAATGTPILALDIWEHAYYGTYFQDRSAYAGAWFDYIDWTVVETLYYAAID